MNITKQQLEQVIQEEYSKLLNELETKVGGATVAVDPKKRSATVSKGDTSVTASTKGVSGRGQVAPGTTVSGRIGKKGAAAGVDHKGDVGGMQYKLGGDIGTGGTEVRGGLKGGRWGGQSIGLKAGTKGVDLAGETRLGGTGISGELGSGGANIRTRTPLRLGAADLSLHGGTGGYGGQVSGIPLARGKDAPEADIGWGSKKGAHGAVSGKNWGVGYQQKGPGAGVRGTYSKKIGPGRLGVQAGYDPKTGGGSAGATYGFRFQENIVRNPHFNQTIQEELQKLLNEVGPVDTSFTRSRPRGVESAYDEAAAKRASWAKSPFLKNLYKGLGRAANRWTDLVTPEEGPKYGEVSAAQRAKGAKEPSGPPGQFPYGAGGWEKIKEPPKVAASTDWKTGGGTSQMKPMVKGSQWQTKPKQGGYYMAPEEKSKDEELFDELVGAASMLAPVPGGKAATLGKIAHALTTTKPIVKGAKTLATYGAGAATNESFLKKKFFRSGALPESVLRQIFLEEIYLLKEEHEQGHGPMDRSLSHAIGALANKIEDLDVSIDYLASIFTGDPAYEIGLDQSMKGRMATPGNIVKSPDR